ncbi:hypothetical protein GCM10009828_063950 [Actinoplanes couchii]|uniref:Uncharacterized protein n=1 Tax=Actinoplanes couchii TaxID=403638 RepID=A0ABQ3X3J4_9ACTN|nr:hypothetical protein Aco03nite_013840 [Actinoplanes couchii]
MTSGPFTGSRVIRRRLLTRVPLVGGRRMPVGPHLILRGGRHCHSDRSATRTGVVPVLRAVLVVPVLRGLMARLVVGGRVLTGARCIRVRTVGLVPGGPFLVGRIAGISVGRFRPAASTGLWRLLLRAVIRPDGPTRTPATRAVLDRTSTDSPEPTSTGGPARTVPRRIAPARTSTDARIRINRAVLISTSRVAPTRTSRVARIRINRAVRIRTSRVALIRTGKVARRRGRSRRPVRPMVPPVRPPPRRSQGVDRARAVPRIRRSICARHRRTGTRPHPPARPHNRPG